MPANWQEVSPGDDENVLILIVGMVAQLCKYSQSHRVVHFIWVNYTVCELCLHKGVM